MIQKCRVCSCSERDPCEEGCFWVEYDLCSACVPKLEEATAAVVRWLALQEAAEPILRLLQSSRLDAADRLRELPKGLDLAGKRYRSGEGRDSIRVGLSPRGKGRL